MGQQIYQTKGFIRQLERLRRSDRKGEMAVEQAGRIIAMLSDESTPLYQRWHKETKSGELRLRNCRKYDLGGGYRLITVLGDDCVVLAWIGSHDQCHYWLEKQLKNPIDPEAVKMAGRLFAAHGEGYDSSAENTEGDPPAIEPEDHPLEDDPPLDDHPKDDPYEEALLERIDQDTLRYVFCGLCRENTQDRHESDQSEL